MLKRLKRHKLATVGAVIIISLILIAILAPFICPYNPLKQNYDELLLPPSTKHWLGTDDLGRDILSRIIHGSRYALLIGVAIVMIEMAIGVTLGLIAGYYGGIIDTAIMRFVDIMLSLPMLVLGLAIAGALGGGLLNVILAIGVIGWVEFSRLIRGEVLSVRASTFVEAARATGTSNFRILIRHILPNTVASIIVLATLMIPDAILTSAALSFLGIGAQPPTPEWGLILSSGRNYLSTAWWIATFPGLAIMLTVLGFNFFGDGLRDALEPKLRGIRI